MGVFSSNPEGAGEQLAVWALWTDREVVVYVAGEADVATLANLDGRLDDVASGLPTQAVVDLAGLDFMDVGSARALAHFRDALERRHCPVLIRSPKPVVAIVLALLGLRPAEEA